MPVLPKPIPAFYAVYILRSTVRRTSLYIGSTPNPVRRLKQHNGDAKGGAARTSRRTLRPWEMVGLVSGFPSMVAALKFEWALNNPHSSLHIPTESRITIATRRKRGGRLRRPHHTLQSIISNAHLLLHVPSFARWPLKIHFFAADVHEVWTAHCADGTSSEPLPRTITVLTDFAPAIETADRDEDDDPPPPWGIHALPLDYTPLKGYVEKTQSLYSFEREGACVICGEGLPPGKGLYATCSATDCEGTGHITCWSQHLLLERGRGRNAKRKREEQPEQILPVSGQCPKCKGEVVWGDMMTEMSLRLRGEKEITKLLKKRRQRKTKAATVDADEA